MLRTTTAAAAAAPRRQDHDKPSEMFVILLHRSWDGEMTDIVAPRGTQTLKEVTASFKKQLSYRGYGSAQVSKRLPSGRAVSASLRWERSQDGGPRYDLVANVTIDAIDCLWWPPPIVDAVVEEKDDASGHTESDKKAEEL
jgi:hypothetical protein